LKRFNHHVGTSKITKMQQHVEFPMELDLGSFVVGAEQQPRIRAGYGLTGVLVHHGANIDNGHNTAFVLHGKQWVEADDHRTKRVSAKVVLAQSAYMLFYQKHQVGADKQTTRRVDIVTPLVHDNVPDKQMNCTDDAVTQSGTVVDLAGGTTAKRSLKVAATPRPTGADLGGSNLVKRPLQLVPTAAAHSETSVVLDGSTTKAMISGRPTYALMAEASRSTMDKRWKSAKGTTSSLPLFSVSLR
jgi:hypothetical protein